MFHKATKEQAKLRLAIFGVSGSGKTLTSLRLAKGIAGEKGKIALIDSEAGSASKYAGGKWNMTFDTCALKKLNIETYIKTINDAKEYDVLIIDSLTHAWQELLQEIESLAQSKFKNNSWSAWSAGTPKQKALVNAILWFPGHIIATMRCKTEWTIIRDSNGKNTPNRVGLSPEQGKGIEYEFDLLMSLNDKHYAEIIKDRTGEYQDKTIKEPDETFGAGLKDWLSDGVNLIAALEEAKTIDELKEAYTIAYNKSSLQEDDKMLAHLQEIKDKRKEFLLKQEPKTIGEKS